MAEPTRILVVDNHDSFVHTIVGYLEELGAVVELVEADALIDVEDAVRAADGILISPGPGAPADAGASLEVIRAAASQRIPLLGVCLGHQALAEAFGATVAEAPELRHGITSDVVHSGEGVFAGIPSPFAATRYHSLAVVAATLPGELMVTAQTADGTVMGLAHRTLPLWGVQFHPESVLTEHGYLLLGTWLEQTGLAGAATRGRALSPHREDAG